MIYIKDNGVVHMARKPAKFEVIFHLPSDDMGNELLAKTLGEVHVKMIKEIMNRKIKDIGQRNKMMTEVQKKLCNQPE